MLSKLSLAFQFRKFGPFGEDLLFALLHRRHDGLNQTRCSRVARLPASSITINNLSLFDVPRRTDG